VNGFMCHLIIIIPKLEDFVNISGFYAHQMSLLW